MPSQAQVEGLVRMVLGIAAGLAIKSGINEATWVAITGGVVGIVGALWSMYSNSTTRMVEQVAKDSDVKEVVTTQAISDAVPSNKVVSNGGRLL